MTTGRINQVAIVARAPGRMAGPPGPPAVEDGRSGPVLIAWSGEAGLACQSQRPGTGDFRLPGTLSKFPRSTEPSPAAHPIAPTENPKATVRRRHRGAFARPSDPGPVPCITLERACHRSRHIEDSRIPSRLSSWDVREQNPELTTG